MTTPPALSARSISTLVRRAIGTGNAACHSRAAGAVLVVITGNADRSADREVLARAVAAAALQAGYDAARTGEIVTITEPAVEVDEVAPRILTTRAVGAGLVEVAVGGQAIGRTRLRTAGLVERDDRFDAYTTTGTRIGENLTRDAAHALLAAPAEPVQLAHLMGEDLLAACGSTGDALGLYVVPFSTPERVTCPACRPLIAVQAARVVEDDHAEATLVEEVADALTSARPALPILRPGVDPGRAAAELEARPLTAAEVGVMNAAHLLTRDRLARQAVEETLPPAEDRHAGVPCPCTWTHPIRCSLHPEATAAREAARLVEPGPEIDDPREQPESLEWSEVAGR